MHIYVENWLVSEFLFWNLVIMISEYDNKLQSMYSAALGHVAVHLVDKHLYGAVNRVNMSA